MFVARVARQTKTREYKDLDAHFTANLGYSHHQKAVIMDAPAAHVSNKMMAANAHAQNAQNAQTGAQTRARKIVAYTGGIDLTGEGSIMSISLEKTIQCQGLDRYFDHIKNISSILRDFTMAMFDWILAPDSVENFFGLRTFDFRYSRGSLMRACVPEREK